MTNSSFLSRQYLALNKIGKKISPGIFRPINAKEDTAFQLK